MPASPPTSTPAAPSGGRLSLLVLGLVAVCALPLGGLGGCASKSEAVSAAPSYTAGQPVHINWQGTWYAGRVVAVGGGANDGKYEIHYDGWADSWDEWVTPDKLRLPTAGVATGSRPS